VKEQEDLVEQVKTELVRMVEIPSPSGQEQRLLQYIETRLHRLNLPFHRQYVYPPDRYNIVVNPRPRSSLLICAHVDTVPPLYHEADPFQGRIIGNRVHGLGCADDKASICAILQTLELLRQDHIDLAAKSISIAFLVDEEEEGMGSRKLVEEYSYEQAIVLEPTDLAICPYGAGSIEVKVEVYGREAHGSAIEQGENAILKAISLINEIQGYLKGHNKRHRFLGKNLLNVEKIEGGFDALIVPKVCSFILDIRTLPGQQPAIIKGHLERLFKRYRARYEFRDLSPAFQLEPHEQGIVTLLREAYRQALGDLPRRAGMKSWTDAHNLRQAGTLPLVFGPGNLILSHTSEEYVDLDQIVSAIKVLHRLILSF